MSPKCNQLEVTTNRTSFWCGNNITWRFLVSEQLPLIWCWFSFCLCWCYITRFETRVTQRVLHVEQELLTLPEHLSSPEALFVFVLLDLLAIVLFVNYPFRRSSSFSYLTFSFILMLNLTQNSFPAV
jgi:hypothetical protein